MTGIDDEPPAFPAGKIVRDKNHGCLSSPSASLSLKCPQVVPILRSGFGLDKLGNCGERHGSRIGVGSCMSRPSPRCVLDPAAEERDKETERERRPAAGYYGKGLLYFSGGGFPGRSIGKVGGEGREEAGQSV